MERFIAGEGAKMTSGLIVRGDLILPEEEFKAHIAQAVRLERVSVLLGAGASVGAGGLTMRALWDRFSEQQEASHNYLVDHQFISRRRRRGALPNIERVIDSIEVARLELTRRGANDDLAELNRHRANLLRVVVRAAVLDEHLLADPSTSAVAPGLADHRRLLSYLVANRQPGQAAPWVFTTNYDVAVECAAEAIDLNIINGFGGIHARKFSPTNFELGFRNVNARGEAQFGVYNIYLAKMHGSLSWRVNADQSVSEVQVGLQWPTIQTFLQGQGDDAPGVLVYPGSSKFVESTGFVYGEMIRRMSEVLSRSNGCLITTGYGFGDFHINRILISALQNPTLQLILYLPEIEQFDADPETGELTITGENVSDAVRALIAKKLPQVTVCGGGNRAHFNRMTLDLPQPALVDEQAKRSREIMKLLSVPYANQPLAPVRRPGAQAGAPREPDGDA